ncbi:hypothetical protein CQW23_01813 [Capsicum baccatum]|uniref:Uncharacterized protein n=1 Tax=Capsicum baccatum TaxID=33114 RepID=A0A2G2XPP6_CAPBA|nr:hypothetical protein CQW23_01813 [Capsicum baccatum]
MKIRFYYDNLRFSYLVAVSKEQKVVLRASFDCDDFFDLDIRIQIDKDNDIITITDSGIGMTHQELVDCLGTIAQSGTAKSLKALKDNKDAGADNNSIGQFGVGFYLAFLVSEQICFVEVSIKSPKSDKQYVWVGEANSSTYAIQEETDPAKKLPRVEVDEDPAEAKKEGKDETAEVIPMENVNGRKLVESGCYLFHLGDRAEEQTLGRDGGGISANGLMTVNGLMFMAAVEFNAAASYAFTKGETVANAVSDLCPFLAFTLILNGIQPVLSVKVWQELEGKT